ncbi:hypothetical protein SUGI_0323730 [Cryptomeria japonica]|uniref:SKP1-like protein 10 n=1 Tax=Cryptomeria japonica TaxID=3369 RepID=UPI002408D22C|nr:SKP1-like protein 10 [Cryptomeria japonica]GLJ18295.1 hypothetical protein SUGI_0323730 [Cryptomeria japonica]
MAKVTLQSSEGQLIEVEEGAALQSEYINKMLIENTSARAQGSLFWCIVVPNVSNEILKMVMNYCEYHFHNNTYNEDVKNSDDEFVEGLKTDGMKLLNVVYAANELRVKSLMKLTCKAVSDIIKDMSIENVRQFLGIQNDFSKEEERKIRQEYEWTFHGF